MSDWLSLHIFYHDIGAHETLLLEYLYPMIRKQMASNALQQWFFVRYWEGGPHLRLRLQGKSDVLHNQVEPAIRRAAAACFATHPSSTTLDRKAFYGGHPMDGQLDRDTVSLPWYPNESVHQIVYQPELARYGGPAGMSISEMLFWASSELSVAVLKATRGDRAKRLSLSLEIMLATALGLGVPTDRLPHWLHRYAQLWTAFTPSPAELAERAAAAANRQREAIVRLLRRITEPGPAGKHPLLAGWLQTLGLAYPRYQQLLSNGELTPPWPASEKGPSEWRKHVIPGIAFSQAHMCGNRMGISPGEEAYLALLAQRVLESA